MKKLTLGLLGLLLILIIGMVTIPFFVNVDRFRPEIVELVNSKLNGHFDLGKLKLTLWGEIAVEADEAILTDSNKAQILSVGKFKLRVPVRSLLSMKPEIQVVMQKPKVQVKRDQRGEWNVLSLMKKEKSEGTGEMPAPEPKSLDVPKAVEEVKAPNKQTSPSWAERASVSISIEEATLQVEDLKSNSHTELDRLNLETGALSLNSLPVFKLSGILGASTEGRGGISGPFEITGESKDETLNLSANLDKVSFSMGAFQKKSGSPTRLLATIKKTGDLYISEGELEPVKVTGDYLKQDLEVTAQWKASSESVDKAVLKLKAKAFDCEVSTQVKSFENPKIMANVLSNEMDLDELVDWVKMGNAPVPVAKRAEVEKGESPSPVSKTTKNTNVASPSTLPSSPSPVAKAATGEIVFNVKVMKLYQMQLEPVQGKFLLKDQKLVGIFDETRLWGGKLKGTTQVDLRSKVPQYAFQVQLNGLSLGEAVASKMEFLKNTISGSLSGEMSGSGEGADANSAKKSLNANGKMFVAGAKLNTFDIHKMVAGGIKGVYEKVSEKVPALKGKELKMGDVSSEFRKITATFTIKDGEFQSTDFVAEAVPQKGVDIKGSTKVGLLDYALKADWEVYDTYNLLRVDPILIERGKPFRIPISVGGTLLSPEYSYLQIPEALVQVALKNLGSMAQDKATQEIKKQAEGQIKNILKGIFK
ncbi:MAG: AsmA family protein [Proteobacteria bacterium]|nr:AsmA family protein [Pseudomonadota bacterium]